MTNALPDPGRRAFRAATSAVLAASAAAVIWQLRPAVPTPTVAPDADVVLCCAWLAWALAGYLMLAIAVTSLSHLMASLGLDTELLRSLTPARVRRFLDLAITVGIAAAVLGTTAAPAGATLRHQPSSRRGPGPATSGAALDWPGLARPTAVATQPPAVHAAPSAAAPSAAASRPQPGTHHHRADVWLVTAGRTSTATPSTTDGTAVVVARGDSLWSIAARHLGPTATAAAVVTAWHQWYATNRQVIGDNPDLIQPGQRLRAPAHAASRVPDSRSTP